MPFPNELKDRTTGKETYPIGIQTWYSTKQRHEMSNQREFQDPKMEVLYHII